ncbi:hypothetical protein NLJ89_g6424 [Agrocybe chaxingu]|uniref:Uncharacterized protein n=1 Tax=Agrocybe chaxingu TaxID=84603 RepID=A0A9W8MWF0_9AGAR|nr:hypothetical protein NLJ89_g6424 [Agrocybe chaxingu]
MAAPVVDRKYDITEFILGDVPDRLKDTSLDEMEASLVDIAERFARISTDPIAGQIPSVGINFKDANASTLDLIGLTLHDLGACASPSSLPTATLLSTIKYNHPPRREVLETVENYWGDSLRVDPMIEDLPFQRTVYEADNPAVIEYFTSEAASVQGDEITHEEVPATQGEGPKKVYADRITCFTGTLDFTRVYFAQEKGKAMRKGLEEKKGNSYPETVDELLEEPIFKKLREEDDPFLMFVTESNDANLEQVLPSVLVKATLLADKFEKKQVTWCSTSGFDWMFGVLVTEGPTQARTAYRTEILSLDGLRGATSIFLSLAFWGMTPAQDILDAFSSMSNELIQRPGEQN